MTGRLLGLIVLLCALGASWAARAADPVPAPSMLTVDRTALFDRIESTGRRGFLYEVSRSAEGGAMPRRLYLYGTIHIGREDTLPFNRAVLAALKTSTRLALEADPSDAAHAERLVHRLGIYPAGDGLERHVPATLVARAAATGSRHGLAADRLARFKPWMLANLLVVIDTVGAGLNPGMGSEMLLAGYAHGARMPIVEIEGIEAQLKLFNALPDALQEAQLDEALSEIESGTLRTQSNALFALWSAGNAAAAEQLARDLHRDAAGKRFESYFVESLIDARNLTMADAAERYMAQDGTTFFAVGTLHLFGERGLIREFERRGYAVRDLQQ